MPLTRIRQTAIGNDSITTTKLDDTSGGLTLPGVEYVKVPAGNTAQRPSSPVNGYIRYNTDFERLEQYADGQWQSIDTPPSITSLSYSSSLTAADPTGGETITLVGSNFQAGATVTVGGTSATSVSVVSSTSITFTTPAKTAGDYDVVVTNSNGLAASLLSGISYNGTPSFTTASGNLGSIAEDQAMSTITIVAAEPDGGTLAYSVTSGALPTGVSLGSANGQITGTPNANPSVNTTFNFTVTATDDENQTNSRAFNLIVLRPIYATQLNKSLRFNDNDSAYLTRTPSAASNRRTWTWSGWVKRANIQTFKSMFAAQSSSSNRVRINFGTNHEIQVYGEYTGGTSSSINLQTNAKFRDTSGWLHIVLAFDTTQSTASNRAKLYVNGDLQSLSAATYPSQNDQLEVNTTNAHYIGQKGDNSEYLDGYLSDIHFIDGQALTPTSFAEEFNGVWAPKNYTGSFGTNGFHLDFADSSAIGNDVSGNDNDFAVSGLAATDVVIDSPTNNFATYSYNFHGAGMNLLEGALKFDGLGWSSQRWGQRSTIPIPRDKKIYIELECGEAGANWAAGIGTETSVPSGTNVGGTSAVTVYETQTYVNGTATVQNSSGFVAGDVLGIAVDGSTGEVWFSLNGTWYTTGGNVGDPSAGNYPVGTVSNPNNEELFLVVGGNTSTNNLWVNFGQDTTNISSAVSPSNGIGSFEYDVPTDHVALCAKNLSESAINTALDDRPEDYFTTTLYVGDNTNDRTITTGFTPDFVWLKTRNSTATHILYDSIRGNTHWISTVSNPAQGTNSSLGWSDSGPTTNGFKVYKGTNSSINNNGTNMVAWTWKAGGAPTASNSNTSGAMTANSVSLNGTLQSSYTPSGSPTQYPTKMSVNTKAGFSIVGWTGTGAVKTLPHGLSQTPEFMVLKGTDARAWTIWHKNLTSGAYYVNFSSTAAQSSDNAMFNSTAPDANLFTIGSYNYVNAVDYFGYFWHSVPGYSKIGIYQGNNVANDGPYVDLGFKPAWVMLKSSTNASTPWQIYDNKRSPINPVNEDLVIQGNNTEPYSTNSQLDFMSNGFKLMSGGNNGWNNYNTGYWIYMAFAEDPFKYAEAR